MWCGAVWTNGFNIESEKYGLGVYIQFANIAVIIRAVAIRPIPQPQPHTILRQASRFIGPPVRVRRYKTISPYICAFHSDVVESDPIVNIYPN